MNDFTKEQMLTAYHTLPEIIKDALDDPKNNETILGLQKKYQLHIDSMAAISRETSCLLLGLTNPAQYAERLHSKAGIPDATVMAIVKEVNEKIFAPLREKMQAAPAAPAPAVPMPQTQAAAPSAPTSSAPKPPTQPAAPFPKTQNLNPNTSPVVRPPAQPQALRSAGLAGALKAAGVPLASLPAMHGSALLEDHEEPHMALGVSGQVLGVSGAAIQPKTQNPVLKPSPQAPAPVAPPKVMPTAMPQAPIAKSYAVDPYREPIDE